MAIRGGGGGGAVVQWFYGGAVVPRWIALATRNQAEIGIREPPRKLLFRPVIGHSRNWEEGLWTGEFPHTTAHLYVSQAISLLSCGSVFFLLFCGTFMSLPLFSIARVLISSIGQVLWQPNDITHSNREVSGSLWISSHRTTLAPQLEKKTRNKKPKAKTQTKSGQKSTHLIGAISTSCNCAYE